MLLLDVLATVSLLLGCAVLYSVRRGQIHTEYSVGWLAAAAVLFVLSRWPAVLVRAANFLGLPGDGGVLPLLLLLVFVAFLYRFSVILSQLKNTNHLLTQRLAILELQFRLQRPQSRSAGAA
jgi:hypothetical protein